MDEKIKIKLEQRKGALDLARMVLEQKDLLRVKIAGNGPTIGEVILRAMQDVPKDTNAH